MARNKDMRAISLVGSFFLIWVQGWSNLIVEEENRPLTGSTHYSLLEQSVVLPSKPYLNIEWTVVTPKVEMEPVVSIANETISAGSSLLSRLTQQHRKNLGCGAALRRQFARFNQDLRRISPNHSYDNSSFSNQTTSQLLDSLCLATPGLEIVVQNLMRECLKRGLLCLSLLHLALSMAGTGLLIVRL